MTAKSEEQLIFAIKNALLYDEKILVERLVTKMTEVNCSILGDSESQRASVLERVNQKEGILSYDDKYSGNGKNNKIKQVASSGMASLDREIPADIAPSQTSEIQNLGVAAFLALNACGVVRIDFIIDDKKVYINEINNIPGSLSYYL